jgi:hypothetical protein
MGWTSYHATNYNKKGQVDRVAEVKDICTSKSEEHGTWTPLKAVAVGSTVYVAVKREKPTGENYVYAEVILTSVKSDDYFNFCYKDMDETCGPFECDCPNSILKLLSPTDNQNAIDWRRRCHERNEEKKVKVKDPDSLNNLPLGSVIEMPHWDGDTRVLTKRSYHSPKTIWADSQYRYTTKTIEKQGYTVIRRGY